jgi:hypothetical protein
MTREQRIALLGAAVGALLLIRRKREGGLGAPPDVHDRAFTNVLASVLKTRTAAQDTLNKVDRANIASLKWNCPIALRALMAASNRLGRLDAHQEYRDDPAKGVTLHAHPLARARRTSGAAVTDAADYFIETCVQGHALTPDEWTRAGKLLKTEVTERVDALRRDIDKITGRRGHLRLVHDDE